MSTSNIPIVDLKKNGSGFEMPYLAYKIAIQILF